MAFYPIRRARLSQPRGDGIDWANKFARGLIYAFNGATGRDEVSGRPATNVKKAVCAAGVGHNVSGAADVALVSGVSMKATDAITLFALLDHPQPNGAWAGMIGKTDDYNSTGTRIGMGFDAVNYLSLNHPVSNYTISASALWNLSGKHSYAAVLDGTSASGYVDGVFDASTTVTASTIPANNDAWRVGSYNGSFDENCIGKHLLHLVWPRALGANEIKALHANPWQVFL